MIGGEYGLNSDTPWPVINNKQNCRPIWIKDDLQIGLIIWMLARLNAIKPSQHLLDAKLAPKRFVSFPN